LVLLAATAIAAFALWPRQSHDRVDACGPVATEPWESGVGVAGQTTLCLVNRERINRGLPALRENATLDQASVEHSQDMVRLNYFEHTAADGRTVGDRLRALGYERGVNASAGENIAYGVGPKATPAAIVKAWMNSPPHRADILRRTFTEIGIGVALGAPEVNLDQQKTSATYTTDFGGVFDPSLPNG
jgi:uncharacterized protein YkwD